MVPANREELLARLRNRATAYVYSIRDRREKAKKETSMVTLSQSLDAIIRDQRELKDLYAKINLLHELTPTKGDRT